MAIELVLISREITVIGWWDKSQIIIVVIMIRITFDARSTLLNRTWTSCHPTLSSPCRALRSPPLFSPLLYSSCSFLFLNHWQMPAVSPRKKVSCRYCAKAYHPQGLAMHERSCGRNAKLDSNNKVYESMVLNDIKAGQSISRFLDTITPL